MVVGCWLWVVGCGLLVVGCLVVLLIASFIHSTKQPNNKTTKQQNHQTTKPPNNKITILKHCYLIHYRKKTKADDFYGSLRCVP